jgi:hypothetical protein
VTQPIVPPSPPTSELPSPELPATGEPEDLAQPPRSAGPPPRLPKLPPPRLPKLPRATSEHPADFLTGSERRAPGGLARPAAAGSTVDRTPLPGKLPVPVSEPDGLPPLYPKLPPGPESAQLPAVDLDLASSRVRARGTPRGSIAPGEQIRTLVFAPDKARAAWIDRELSHPPITVQVGRSARNVVAALTRDPPPRPDVLVIDFDAIAPVDLVELHAIRPGGWCGRMIGVGDVTPELCASLGVDHVLAPPLVRDSLLDCVAGTRHAATTTACPVFPERIDRS